MFCPVLLIAHIWHPPTTTCLACKRCTTAILQMTTNSNKVFVLLSDVEAGNFTTLVHGVFLNVGKMVLKTMQTLWKNGLMNAKDV
jgi:hypothetical protein